MPAAREVKHTGDGIMASFASVPPAAIDYADRDPTRVRSAPRRTAEHPIHVRIGVSAGEPVAEGDDLFGAAVQLAARACDQAAAGMRSSRHTAVRELCVGKGFTFEARGPFELKGFEDPVPLHEVSAGAPR